MKRFFSGLAAGLLLQLAVGPVFFYVLGIALGADWTTAMFAVLAVTLADYIYIALSLAGVGKALERPGVRKPFALASALVLAVFGILSIKSGLTGLVRGALESSAPEIASRAGAMLEGSMPGGSILGEPARWTPASSFAGAFALTITSPLTIVFWGSVFSAKATELGMSRTETARFGIGAGFATLIFLSLSTAVLSVSKTAIPEQLVRALNLLVGLVLAIYGLSRLIRNLSRKEA